MKEYIKKFNTLVSANNYDIADIPFTSTVGGGTFINLVCNTPNKRIVVKDNTLDIFTVITGTWNSSLTDKTTKVIISGEVVLNSKTDCYSLTFEEGGHLTINAGARLRIWKGGITNNDCTTVNYLTIIEDAVNDSYGEFLLHPDVTVNNHPLASVKLISPSYTASGSNYKFHRCCIPTYTLNNVECKYDGIDKAAVFMCYDYIQDDFVVAGYINFPNKPALDVTKLNKFEYIQIQINTPNACSVLTFNGTLAGNASNSLSALANCLMGFGNSYSGKIKTAELLDNLVQGELNMQHGHAGGSFVIITQDNVAQYPYIYPAQHFLINNGGNQAFTQPISYKDLVWDPSFEEEVTTTRSLTTGTLTSTNQTEINTTLEGSGIFDNPEPVFPPEHDEK